MTLKTLRLSDPFGETTYREAGLSNAGKTNSVVFVHGVGMQSAAWEPQLQALGATHHVIALDMPGHGGSDCLPLGVSLSVYVEWLVAALDALQLDRVNLVGHSMGALISGGVAVTHSSRLDRVALLNGVFCRDAAASEAVKARAQQIQKGAFDLETPLKRWFGDSGPEQTARKKVSEWLSAVNIEGYATAYTAFAEGDAHYADRFSNISCPLLALTGRDDLNSSPEMSQAMADAAPKGRAQIIEHHRHMVNLTAPDAVNAALEDWLQTPLEEENTA